MLVDVPNDVLADVLVDVLVDVLDDSLVAIPADVVHPLHPSCSKSGHVLMSATVDLTRDFF